jgi:hypothetical protein
MAMGTRFGRFAGGLLAFLAGSAGSAGAALAVGPELGLPTVSVPSAPSLPKVVSAPRVHPAPVPRLPAVPVPQVPAAPVAPAPTLPGVGFTAPAPAGLSGASSVGAAVSRVAAGTRGFAAAADERGADRAARRQAARRRARARARAARRERSFRRKVRRHASCFYALSDFDRRVLAMRAGLRGARGHSRAYVARVLEVPSSSIRRAEHRGLGKLRKANRSDGCARGASHSTGGSSLATRMRNATPVAQAVVFGAAGAASGDVGEDAGASFRDRGDVAGVKRSSGGEKQAKRAGLAPARAGSTDADGGVDVDGALLAALLAMAAVLAGGAVARAHRRRTTAATAAAAEGGAGERWTEAEEELAPAPWTEPEEPPKDPGASREAGQHKTHGSPATRYGQTRRPRSRHRG